MEFELCMINHIIDMNRILLSIPEILYTGLDTGWFRSNHGCKQIIQMNITGKTRLLGVIGWPVEHSLSPPMHHAALAGLGLDWTYIAMPVKPGDLETAVYGARTLGMIGLNCTLPHKEVLLELVDEADAAARLIGAVNTLHFTDQGIRGYNTDALGYIETVSKEADFNFKGCHVFQSGAGGAGRAMAVGAAQAGMARLTLANRDPDKALALADHLHDHFPDLEVVVAETENQKLEYAESADLIANATSLGMRDGDPLPVPTRILGSKHTVFDTVYVSAETPLLVEAQKQGARPVSGLGMLARQGAASLRIWSGMEPDEELMISTLRQHLNV
jgi:shikimate dehydrogenase